MYCSTQVRLQSHALSIVGVIGEHGEVATDNPGNVLMAAVAPMWALPISYTAYSPSLLWYLSASTIGQMSSYALLAKLTNLLHN